jgi:beta-galactosidase
MYSSSHQFVGGAHWHPFDHQRGYHPDPFWGGLMDAFRQPKYSYYMFQSQMSASSKPMVFVAHEITPFSDADVVVFTNCDEVRLIAHGRDTLIQKVNRVERGMPNPPLVFKDVFDFKDVRHYSYVQKNWQQINFVAEGIINGEVVVSERKMPARRSNKISLRLDNENQPLVANGSDFTTVIAEITDDNGNVRRLAKENIFFTVEGEGTIIGSNAIGANPRAIEFGSAPLLVRSTLNAGEIKVIARLLYEGENTPTPDTIVFRSVPSLLPLVYLDIPNDRQGVVDVKGSAKEQILSEEEKQKMLMEVEQQQTEFGVKKKE